MEIEVVTQQVTVLRMTEAEKDRYISHPELLALELARNGNGHGPETAIPVVRKPVQNHLHDFRLSAGQP